MILNMFGNIVKKNSEMLIVNCNEYVKKFILNGEKLNGNDIFTTLFRICIENRSQNVVFKVDKDLKIPDKVECCIISKKMAFDDTHKYYDVAYWSDFNTKGEFTVYINPAP